MSFVRRALQFDFNVAPSGGTFTDGTTSKSLTGLRASVQVDKVGGPTNSQGSARIFGLDLDTMRPLTKLQAAWGDVNKLNTLTIKAGIFGQPDSMQEVFQGTIYEAWADIQSAPDTAFVVTAVDGLVPALTPAPATSVKGAADVATVMNQLANQMGYRFENETNLQVKVDSPYLPQTSRDQVLSLAQQANVNVFMENNVLAIWPKDQPRQAPGAPFEVSPNTGMVGYPTFTAAGLIVRSLFRPDIIFGTQINVTSAIQPASGLWTIWAVHHLLDSETPGGRWFTEIETNFLDHPGAIGST